MDSSPSLFAPPPPLAARMRARTLAEFVGQSHLVGPGRLLWRSLKAGRLFSSMIFWGPPGSGKTTLARIMASALHCQFVSLSAVMSGVADLRRVVEEARRHQHQGTRTVVLIDEIHRFNKAQQDALLPHVEEGLITLVGATTENPYFEIIGPLLSRARIFIFEPLTPEDIGTILARALSDRERGLGSIKSEVSQEALDYLAVMAGGDARRALNALELAVMSTDPDKAGVVRVDLDAARECMPRRDLMYDRAGEAHYDTLSAFIKSVRGSDADRGSLLAGPDADGRRGPPPHHAPAAHPGVRRYRPGGPQGTYAGGGGVPGPKLGGPAGRAVSSGPGHPVSGPGPQEQLHPGLFPGPGGPGGPRRYPGAGALARHPPG